MKTRSTIFSSFTTQSPRCLSPWVIPLLLLLGASPMAPVQPGAGTGPSVVTSPHNLSASGAGSARATSESEICIFCHTPHTSGVVRPAWNRNAPVSAYVPYTSTSLQSLPGQPTGSSKLCLSCHDGTIALGSVVSRRQSIQMSGGMTHLPAGHRANLGTDLSDDHPISFRYDQSLVTRNPKLKSPSALPSNIKLDPQQELQCTSCHEAHDNRFGQFLVMRNDNSELCNACHTMGRTDIAAHTQCSSCHQPHTAPSGPWLLKAKTVTETCALCHSGGAGANQGQNIAADLRKISPHDTRFPVNQKNHIPNNVSCNDCHEPHTMLAQSATVPLLSPRLGRINGINAVGAIVPRAQFGYEVCFKCHSDQPASVHTVSRVVTQFNTRLQFAPSAVSFHPVEVAGKGSFVPSLRPGLTTSSLIYCTDCHNSDSQPIGTLGTSGPHGSNNIPLLSLRYDSQDGTSESANAYALCYKCHERSSILTNQSFTRHSSHIVNDRASCSICHDSHGISSAQGTAMSNAHLINFDTSIVQPDAMTHRIQYQSRGPGHGSCTLTCHGVAHSNLSY